MGNPAVLQGHGLPSPIQRAFLALFSQLPDQVALKQSFQETAVDLMGRVQTGSPS
jgi:hypothetical protein